MPRRCLVIHTQGHISGQTMYIMRQTQRSAPPYPKCAPCCHALMSSLATHWTIKRISHPRNYSQVKGQRGRVYLAPLGERALDRHSHHWKRVRGSKRPDHGQENLAEEHHLRIDVLVGTGLAREACRREIAQ